jgi:hypothetical protein
VIAHPLFVFMDTMNGIFILVCFVGVAKIVTDNIRRRGLDKQLACW